MSDPLRHWTPRPRPLPRVLEGRYARLEPLGAQHAADLYAASSPPDAAERFRYLLEGAPADLGAMHAWIETVRTGTDPLYFAVIDRATGRCEGRQALMRVTPEHGVLEIGAIYWGAAIARTRVATEAQYLSARHVFDDLGYRRYEWKCHDANRASKRAALRFGFRYEGLFRQHMVVRGESRDTAWFSIIDGEWPRLRTAYEAWLDPANFDAAGRQRHGLGEYTR
jgi:RimJ/RimL family protein N-acetyltransferase